MGRHGRQSIIWISVLWMTQHSQPWLPTRAFSPRSFPWRQALIMWFGGRPVHTPWRFPVSTNTRSRRGTERGTTCQHVVRSFAVTAGGKRSGGLNECDVKYWECLYFLRHILYFSPSSWSLCSAWVSCPVNHWALTTNEYKDMQSSGSAWHEGLNSLSGLLWTYALIKAAVSLHFFPDLFSSSSTIGRLCQHS